MMVVVVMMVDAAVAVVMMMMVVVILHRFDLRLFVAAERGVGYFGLGIQHFERIGDRLQ